MARAREMRGEREKKYAQVLHDLREEETLRVIDETRVRLRCVIDTRERVVDLEELVHALRGGERALLVLLVARHRVVGPYSVEAYPVRPLPVVPSLRVNDAPILQGHEEFARVILDVDQAIDQQLDLGVDIARLDAVDLCRHVV